MTPSAGKTSWLPSAATALAVLIRYGMGSIVAMLPALGNAGVVAGIVSSLIALAVILIGASSWRRRAPLPLLAAVAGLVLVLWSTWSPHIGLVETLGFALLILGAILDWRSRAASRTAVGDFAWIEVSALAERLGRQSPPVVIDVRSPEEFVGELGHIEGARNLPLGEIPQHLHELDSSKSEAVVLVCKTQMRSAKAAATLTAAGFQDVAVLRGGMIEWVRQRDQARDAHG